MEYIALEEKVKESFYIASVEDKPDPEETARMWLSEFWIGTIGCLVLNALLLSASIQQIVSGFRKHCCKIEWFTVGFGIFLFFIVVAMFGFLYYVNKKRVKKGRVFPRNQEKTIECAKEYIRHYEFLLKEAKILDEKWKQLSA